MKINKKRKFKIGEEWESSFIREKTINKLWCALQILEIQNVVNKSKEKLKLNKGKRSWKSSKPNNC